MKTSGIFAATLVGSVALGLTAAHAAVPQAQADRLGKDLTPMGAERAGNGSTIPAWTGGLPTPPPGISHTEGERLKNPFASDPVLYTVTPANMGEYDAVLTDGYKKLMSIYDTYKMNVYESRRSCAFPEFVYEANKRNAQVAELIGGGNGVGAGIMGTPFPILNNGLEAIWNHTLRYRAFKVTRQFTAAPVTATGGYQLQKVQDEAILQWSDPNKGSAEELDNISIYYIANTVAPARAAGSVILVHETLDRSIDPRKAWQYSPGTRRVRRAPNIAYDNPGTNSDGLSTSDSFDGYNGAPDRYDWKLRGKSEKLIAYNAYDAESAPYDEYIQARHLNQDKVRYELHRVWTVEANLRPDNRHVYSRRVKHIDEDAWQLAQAELYDGRGELWRVQELHTIQRYNVPLCGSGTEVVYDTGNGRYLALAMQNEEPGVNYFADELNADRYTPASIRQLGVR